MSYMPNTAGSFPMASLYPGMGNGVTQTMDTKPEPEEQAVITNIDAPSNASAVDPRSKLNMWVLLGGLILLVVLFGKG